ncbi:MULTISPECIES: acetyltransferase [Flavobacterium]|uniref:acetyltransferase n=1 Tax=Flavobacterium TaxID=237 RepID=UPI0011842F2E|nr:MULTISPECIES: acetyltransferase [Flavobacterium]MCR4030930.1 acetyltransferase [Flavobacterium panacis]
MEGTQYSNDEIIILGAGGLAREIASWYNISSHKNGNIIGFIDDNLDALNDYNINLQILGKIDLEQIKYNQSIICGISNVEVKEKLYHEIVKNKILVRSYIHESCLIGERTNLGTGFVLLPNALVSCDVSIGNLVLVNIGSQVGHDVSIGDFTSIMANVDIGGGAKIGKNVFIGSNAVILPGVVIPDNTRIGAGALVLKSIKQSGTYFGNPARKIF